MKLAILSLLAATGCATTQPVDPISLPAAPPPGPWAAMRNALESCAIDRGLVGDLKTRVVIGDDGIIMNIHSPYGNEYASCVGTSMLRTRFRAQRGRALDVSFSVIPPPETAISPPPAAPLCPEECTN